MILNSTRRLAIDNSCLVKARGVISHVESVEKYKDNPVILPDTPWEQDVHIYGSVIKVDGIYKMWYFARCEEYAVHMMNYAESLDGIHWTKPELDVVEYKGHKTNIVFGTPIVNDFFGSSYTVLYTPWDKGKEYKMLFTGVCSGEYNLIAARRQTDMLYKRMEAYRNAGDMQMEQKIGIKYNEKMEILRAAENNSENAKRTSALFVAWSSDGIHWDYSNEPACYEIDDISHMFYDHRTQEYMIYGRTCAFDPGRVALDRNLKQFDGCAGRAVALARSKDGMHFTPAELIYNTDAMDRPGDEVYSMSVFPWQDAYLALVQIYHGAPDDMTQDIQLAFSKDAVHFTRVGDRNPIIPLGGIGEWDRFNTCMADEPVIENGKVRFYFNGALFRHPQVLEVEGFDHMEDTWKRLTYIGFGEIEEDRFACLMSSFDGGEIETVPFVIDGDKLCLNCISRFGELVVKFIGNESGTCEEVVVARDGIKVEINVPEWAKKEKTSLHFTLKNAKLYSYCAY